MKTRQQRKAAKALAHEIQNSLHTNPINLPLQNHAIIHDAKTLQPIHCTQEQAIEAIKSTSVDGYEFEDVVNMFATYIQRLYKLSTQKKKPQRKPPTHERLQNIQIFENIQKKRKLTSPSQQIQTLPTRYTKSQSPGLFFDKENQFISPVPKVFLTDPSTFKTLQNTFRFNSNSSISPDGYREYFNHIQESPFVSDFPFLKPEPKVEENLDNIQVKVEAEEVKSIATNQLTWLEKITAEDIQQIMETLKMEPIIETKQEEETTELAISPRFYESPKINKASLQTNKLQKVKNSMINSYISYLISADKNHLDNEKLRFIYPTFSMVFDDILQRNLTEKSTGLPNPTIPRSEGFTLRREGSWSFSRYSQVESDFEISSPLLIEEEEDFEEEAAEEIEVYREFNSQVEVEAVVNEENFIKPVMVDKKLETETLCLKMVHDTILKSHLPAQTSQPMERPILFRYNIAERPQEEVHFGGSSNRMIIENGQLLRDQCNIEEDFAQETAFIFQQEDEENIVSMEYEEEEKSNSYNGVDELEGDVVVASDGYGYDTKEDAKRAFYDEEYYQARANNVYYVVSVLLVAIIAKLYMSLFRMYSLRNSSF